MEKEAIELRLKLNLRSVNNVYSWHEADIVQP